MEKIINLSIRKSLADTYTKFSKDLTIVMSSFPKLIFWFNTIPLKIPKEVLFFLQGVGGRIAKP